MLDHHAVRADYHALVRREIAPLIPKGASRLLDVGGGVGATAAWLKGQGNVQRAGVIDLVKPDQTHPDLDFYRAGNIETSDILARTLAEEGPFDLVLCLDVLEHLVDPWAVVAALHKGLAPGGAIVASIPNIRHYRASFPLFFQGRWDLEESGIRDRTHLRWFVRDTAVALMQSSGLAVDMVIPKPGGRRRDRLMDQATLGLFKGFFTLQYLIRARRPD